MKKIFWKIVLFVFLFSMSLYGASPQDITLEKGETKEYEVKAENNEKNPAVYAKDLILKENSTLKVNGNIDEAVVNSRLTELENKAQTVLANNPVKLRKVLNWLNNFREVSLAWHVTATDGYLQALDKFEKTQIDI